MFRNLLIVFAAAIILGFGGSSQGTPTNFTVKSPRSDQEPKQVNNIQNQINNWGLGNDDRKMLMEMKYKIDSLHNKSTSRAAVILGFGGSSQGTPTNFTVKSPRGQQPNQVNNIQNQINNWGLGNDDRKMLMEMKSKIDSLHHKSTSRDCSQDGWVYYGNFGYLIINIRTMKWSDARRTCQMLGGDLAIIKSAAENNFIFSLLKKQKTVTDLGVWLGFVRKADNKFYWIDDTPLAKGYTAWDSRQPDHVIEKCGNMFGTTKMGEEGKWNDATCYIDPAKHWKVLPVILCKKKQIV